jgi:Flp pilus assembly protein TadG
MFYGLFRTSTSLLRAKNGSVAVEFALIGLPFFMMIMGLLEVAFMYASATVLEGGTVAAARMVRTGQAQHSADATETFKTTLCDQVSALIPCADLVFEAIHPPDNTFADADGIPPQFDSHGNLVSQGFDPGGVNDVVVMRVAYRYHYMTPFVSNMFTNNTDGSVLLMSTVTVKNEPYDFVD